MGAGMGTWTEAWAAFEPEPESEKEAAAELEARAGRLSPFLS